MVKTRAGRISHYFSKIGVAVVVVEAPLKIGDKISIEGGTTKFEQTVSSMQVDKEAVKTAKKGDSVGMKVDSEVKPSDVVYKL